MSDFDGWYKEFQTHRQFPMSIEANNQYVARMAYEAGRKAGLEAAVVLVEKCKSNACCDLGEDWWEYSVDIAAAIRERINGCT